MVALVPPSLYANRELTCSISVHEDFAKKRAQHYAKEGSVLVVSSSRFAHLRAFWARFKRGVSLESEEGDSRGVAARGR